MRARDGQRLGDALAHVLAGVQADGEAVKAHGIGGAQATHRKQHLVAHDLHHGVHSLALAAVEHHLQGRRALRVAQGDEQGRIVEVGAARAGFAHVGELHVRHSDDAGVLLRQGGEHRKGQRNGHQRRKKFLHII